MNHESILKDLNGIKAILDTYNIDTTQVDEVIKEIYSTPDSNIVDAYNNLITRINDTVVVSEEYFELLQELKRVILSDETGVLRERGDLPIIEQKLQMYQDRQELQRLINNVVAAYEG